MAAALDSQRLNLVFQSRPDILDGIRSAADTPARVSLFNEIASFVFNLTNSVEPAAKRRRLDDGQSNGPLESGTGGAGVATEATAAAERVLLEVKDISLQIPRRKKFDLCFTKSYLYARTPGTSAPVQGIVYAWQDIEHVFYLPVPDKLEDHYNYVLFPRNTYLPSQTAASPTDTEPLLFTVPAKAPKPNTISGPSFDAAAAVSDTYSSLFHWALTTSLHAAGNTTAQLVATDPKLFRSAVRQAYSSLPATWVKAFRGSKDGFLFFLPTGILWGFRKPLLFIPLERIAAISYTSVLQRTFNMVVEVEGSDEAAGTGGDNGKLELEFGMLDQEDYSAIDETYVRRHGLQDRSLAERRKAKKELADKARRKGGEDGDEDGGETNGHADGEDDENDGMTELERATREAEQMLQDEEDENEEDYDPGSDGESEGEGSSSGEEGEPDEAGEEEHEEDAGEDDYD